LVSCFIHNLGYPWFELFGAQPFDTAMGLQPTWGLVCVRARSHSMTPQTPDWGPLFTRSTKAVSEQYCWILEILYCNPKGGRALLRIPSTEGRGVCLCWAKSKPEGPQGRERACATLHNPRNPHPLRTATSNPLHTLTTTSTQPGCNSRTPI